MVVWTRVLVVEKEGKKDLRYMIEVRTTWLDTDST